MCGNCSKGQGCANCSCNCQELTPEQEREMLAQKREMLEKKLAWVTEREAELAKKK